MSTRTDSLTRIRDSLLAIIEAQTSAWETAGCPPTMSIDGESYQWDNWLASKMDALDKIDKQINRSNPYFIRSRQRG